MTQPISVHARGAQSGKMNAISAAAVVLLAGLLAGCADPTSRPTVETSNPALALAFDAIGNPLALPLAFQQSPLTGVIRPLPQAAREPTIGVAPDGAIFVGVWDQENLENMVPIPDDDALGTVLAVYASFDQGASWRDVKPRTPALIQVPPTTSDAFMEVDPVTGRVFTNDWTYGCTTMSISDNQGDDWLYSPLGCGIGNGAFDHQSIVTGAPRASEPIGYSRMVYYCVASLCSSSLNGGVSFGPVVCAVPGAPPIPGQCGSANGHVKTDAEGRVLLGLKRGGLPWLTISEDDGATWTMTQVNATHGVYWHDVEFAADSAGTLYAAWQSYDGFPYMAVSTDRGATWGPAARVSPPGLTATGYLMVAAGGPGKVAFVFLGTDFPTAYVEGTHPSTHRGDMIGASWNAYMTVSVDADGASPTFVSVPLNDPADPVAADACWPGYRDCEDVGEFIDIVIAPDGRPWAALFDSCLRVCHETGANEPVGGFRGAVGTLSTGPALGIEGGTLAPLPYVAHWRSEA